MAVTKQDVAVVHNEEPDMEGASSEVHLDGQRVLKEVSVPETCLVENIELTSDFSPNTDYEVIEDIIVVEQERADQVYNPGSWRDLEEFLTETSDIVVESVERGFALDYKPPNFGIYSGETLYIDNQDLGSVRKIDEPELAMATQLNMYLKNNGDYNDVVPDRNEIRKYWS